MAMISIAGADGVGKAAFDRASILCSAHAATRKRMAPSATHRYGDRWNSEAGGYVPHGLTYRQAFASALRWAWREAKIIAEEAAWAAAQPAVSDVVVERAAAIRLDAWLSPITTTGNARYRALMADAGDLETAARLAAITRQAAYAEYVRLALIHNAAAEAALDLLDQYEEPARPGYDHFRSEGGYDIAFTDETRKYGRSLIKVDDKNVEDLEAIIAAPFDPSRSEPSSVKWHRLTHERRIEQAKVTLQTVETWRAERGRRREALGLPAAEKLEAEAYDAAQAQIDVLLGMTPTNLREIAMQALVAGDKEEPPSASEITERLTALGSGRSRRASPPSPTIWSG